MYTLPPPCALQLQTGSLEIPLLLSVFSNKKKEKSTHYRILFVFLQAYKHNNMDKTQMINHIKQTAANVLPKGSTLYLYGSRARGDYHDDSDWDLLILLDKPKLVHEDFNNYSYPFVLMGWNLGADVRPHAYTKDEWFNGPHAMFYYNVEEDKEVLYES